jgi:hypothetical protein
MMRRLATILAWCGFVAMVAGCGYSARPMTREGVRTVYVPIFENRTFRRGLEFDLTREVVDKINQKTQLKIAEKDAADTLLRGEIVEVRQREIVRNEPLKPEEVRVVVYASVTWVDRRTNQVLMKRQNVQSPAEYIVSRRQDFTSASKEAMSDLAEKIVNLMEEAW